MFNYLSFSAAADLFHDIRKIIGILDEYFGEAGVECIVDALHIYCHEGHALKCCGFDEDFAHLFTLAYREVTGHDLKPEYSCLTEWKGTTAPRSSKNESDD